VERQILPSEKVDTALADQKHNGGRLGEVLSRLRIMSADQVATALAEFLSVDRLYLGDMAAIDVKTARALPEAIAKRFSVLAVRETQGAVVLAMADPLDIVARDTISGRLTRPVSVGVSTRDEIHHAIEAVYHGSDVQEKRLRDLVDVVISTEDAKPLAEDNDDGETATDISSEAAAQKAPVIRFVDLLLSQAVKSRASDIHVEPQEGSMLIRMRVDGVLREMTAPPPRMQPAVVARIKILSGMDIAERRLPQDGRFKVKAPGRDIDLRVSSIPTIYGEKIVMRILDRAAVNHDIDALGFDPDLLALLKNSLSQPHGIIIVTGPTGSGKSTTLYSALNHLRDPRKNITTVENPVEYRLAGINQIQIKTEIGLTFAASLRTILRQDPDIILIGEIRDRETMEIAIQASLTGHLVLSTFHTNDAPSALSRLSYMGLERYLLASTLNLVIAQRLVRRICAHCREPVELQPQLLERLNIDEERLRRTAGSAPVFYHGRGCRFCDHSGYAGRVPIFEFLPLDTEMRELVARGFTEAQVRSLARRKGFGGLLESGTRRLLEGVTTPEEVLRVTFVEEAFATNDPAAEEEAA
jgi:type II secretory ATPase GspE/PulE/Tfp pilus assembly ATPase PilB-like protein